MHLLKNSPEAKAASYSCFFANAFSLCVITRELRKQKKFTNQIGDFNGVEGMTEAETLHLPKDIRGTKQLDDGFDLIYNYEELMPYVLKARVSFQKDIEKKLSQNDIEKINSGLKDYVFSAVKKSYNLELLKASIINAFGKDLLTLNYFGAGEEVKQIIQPKYFENIDNYLDINSCWLVNPESIIYYQKRAVKYTKDVLTKFYLKLNQDFDDACVYRGQGNIKYYKNKMVENSSDIISTYTGITEPFPFFERQILNSYSLNNRVAEKFMMHKNNTRRAFIVAELNCIIDNIFSSFIISDIFIDGQYEFLCLPNEKDLFIVEDDNDEICAEYRISSSEIKPIKFLRRM